MAVSYFRWTTCNFLELCFHIFFLIIMIIRRTTTRAEFTELLYVNRSSGSTIPLIFWPVIVLFSLLRTISEGTIAAKATLYKSPWTVVIDRNLFIGREILEPSHQTKYSVGSMTPRCARVSLTPPDRSCRYSHVLIITQLHVAPLFMVHLPTSAGLCDHHLFHLHSPPRRCLAILFVDQLGNLSRNIKPIISLKFVWLTVSLFWVNLWRVLFCTTGWPNLFFI